jgi:hypothetical protein
MKRMTVFLVVAISGCAVQSEPAPEIAQTLKQHQAVLDMIVHYIGDLQGKGILPKPETNK